MPYNFPFGHCELSSHIMDCLFKADGSIYPCISLCVLHMKKWVTNKVVDDLLLIYRNLMKTKSGGVSDIWCI